VNGPRNDLGSRLKLEPRFKLEPGDALGTRRLLGLTLFLD